MTNDYSDIDFNFYDSSGFATGATIQGAADQSFTGTTRGTRLTFSTVTRNTTTMTERMIINSLGRVGIGTSSPSTTFHVNGTVTATAFSGDGSSLTGIGFGSSGGLTSGNSVSDDFVFGSTQLADTGNTAHDDRMFFDKSKAAFRVGRATGTQWDDASVGSFSTIVGGSDNTASGNWSTVGGGTTNTASGLFSTVVGGNANIVAGDYSVAFGRQAKNSNASHDGVFLFADSNSTDFDSIAANEFAARATGGFRFVTETGASPDEGLFITGTGYVGISNSAPSVELDVSGDIEYTGTLTDVSDRRLKTNIEGLEDGLGVLRKIDVYSFNMKDNLDVTEFGVIAQEMKEVLPDLVTVIDNETGYYGVNYMGLIPWTVLGIKELDQQYEQNLEMLTVMDGRLKLIEERVSENERKIASLQDENAELKKRVEKLEAMMLKILEEKK